VRQRKKEKIMIAPIPRTLTGDFCTNIGTSTLINDLATETNLCPKIHKHEIIDQAS